MRAARWFRDFVARPRVLGLAAEVAFWLFLSLLPLAAVGGMVAAKVVTRRGDAVASWLTAIPGPMRTFISNELERVSAWKGGAVAPVSALIFIWLGSSGIHAFFESFEVMTGCKRSWIHKRVIAVVACFGFSLIGAAIALLVGGLEWARTLTGEQTLAAPLGHTLRLTVSCGLVFVVVSALYRIGVPRRARRALPIIPGAIAATLLQVLLVFAYAMVVRTIGDGSAYLAGLGVVGVAMTFIYLHAVSILGGLAVNQGWRAREGRA